ncbi:MAG TPA: carboxypeptidase regulatory-like domain-containing protein, partial [Blastocatellia bacterium]|nr:carboxypeptidase regulatory-like domain-containing protein [Blastocatellia bacterium]
MKLKRIPTAAISSLLCSLLSIAIFAQTAGTSRVTGVIQDQSGSIVPGAKVTLTNEGTNISYTVTTTSAGVYVFDGIQLGFYTVTIEKEGFKKFVSKGNVLTVGQPLTVNASLTIGQAEESIEVTASYERVQTSTSGNLGATVDNKTLTDLPLGLESGTGGRNPLIFVRLQPGVVVGANTGGGSHVNGARDRAFNYTLDGIDINESSAGGSEFSPLRTNPDSLQEFRVITSNATAEYGRSSGAQVALVTKSGTNQLHGNLFYFHRNAALAANEFGNNLNGLDKPALRQHQFGGDIGGPVKIPGVYNGKDRTFFFFNYQGQRQIFPVNLTRTVYTESAKRGIFRYVAGGRNFPAGQVGASVDAAGNPLLPACGGAVTTNCIASYNILANDPRRLGIDPAIQQKVLDLLPAPNNFAGGDGLNTASYIWTVGRLDPQRDFTFKIDHKFNESHTMFVRYAWGAQNTLNDTTNSGAPAFPGLPPKVNTTRDPRNIAVSYRSVITPSLSNEVVVGANHFTFNFINPSVGQQPFSIVTVNPTDPLDFQEGNLRTINTYQIVDNLSWVKGAHLVKGGVNFRYTQHRDVRGSIGSQNAQPVVNLTGSGRVNTACLNGGVGINTTGQEFFCLPTDINIANDRARLQNTINDLLGRVGNISQGFVADTGLTGFLPGGELFLNDARYGEYDFYIQDTWKLRPNLTLDLGIRNELRLTPFARGRLFGPQQPVTLGAPATNALRWVDRDIYESDLNNWSPSIGLAWDPWGDGKTSIRANYRLASDRINTFVLSSAIYNTIPGVTLGVVNTEFGLTGGPNKTGGRISDGIPSVAPSSTAIPQALLQPDPFGTGTITVVDPDFQSPITNQWSLNIQRDLGKNLLVDVAYIGRKASHLFGAYNINQVDILNNGFLNEYNNLISTGKSAFFDTLYGKDTRLNTGEKGSQFVLRQFASSVALNGVAAVAADAAGRIQSGRSLLELAGLPTTFFRPFPQFAGINVIDSNDYSTYHALQVMVQRKFAKGLQFQGSYTFSKSLDTRSFDPAFTVAGTGNAQSSSSTPFDNNRRFLNYARSDFDRTHVFIGYAVWDLPFGKGGWIGDGATGFVQRFIEGWNVNGVLTMQTGRPFTIYSGSGQLSDIVNSTVNCNGCPRSIGELDRIADNFGGRPGYFTAEEIAKFSQPAAGQLGNTGRNYFTGPGAWNVDMALLKRTKFTET